MKEEWTAKVVEAVNFQRIPQFPREVWLDFRWTVKNLARDPDNIAASAKFVMDGLAEAKVIQNDNLKVIQSPVLHWYEKGASDSLFLLISDSPIYSIDKFNLSQVADPTGAYDYDPESDFGAVLSTTPNAFTTW